MKYSSNIKQLRESLHLTPEQPSGTDSSVPLDLLFVAELYEYGVVDWTVASECLDSCGG